MLSRRSILLCRRFFAAPVMTMSAPMRFNSSAAGASSSTPPPPAGELTALDVAMQVNKLKRMHQSGQGSKKQIEQIAWKELNTLSEAQINSAEGKAVALLLNSWAYFAKHWERGKEGPGDVSDAAPKQ